MVSPFKIVFKREIKDTANNTILANFKHNFERTYCDFTKIVEDKELVIENRFLRLKRDMNSNLWVGIGSANVLIEETQQKNRAKVIYTFDFTRLSIAHLFYLTLLFGIYLWVGNDTDLQQIILIGIYISFSISILQHLVMYFRHRSIFLQTIKYGTGDDGYYDWEAILKKKTNDELKKIVNGNTQLPSGVAKLAKMELDKRG